MLPNRHRCSAGMSSPRLVLPWLSTVHKGTAFEQRSLRVVRECLSMNLVRVGGKDDGGVDLRGWWWLPSVDVNGERRRIRVVAQCKAEKKSVGPSYVREMEGVWCGRHVSGEEGRQHSLVGVLISESPFTPGALIRAMSSPVPFLLLHLPPLDPPSPSPSTPTLGAAVWNPALGGANGVLKGSIELRWERALGVGRPGLWFDGRKVESWAPELGDDEGS